MSREAKLRELEQLQAQVQRLEAELGQEATAGQWPPRTYYTAYHVLAGFVLGMFGAATSLLFNVVGALLVPPPPPLEQHPLNLIRVYLTFPLGEAALKIDSGVTLAIGCCLYLATGMLLGIPFQVVLTRWLSGASFARRFAVVSALALALWLFNFYAVLSWLQPLLFGGDWIVRLIPWWVAALTHLVFGWTMLLVQPLGTFVPYRLNTEAR
jgi:hypothetical protein